MAIYATYFTNKFGFLIKYAKTKEEKMYLRGTYAKILFSKLKLNVKVINKEKLPQDGKYLLISNHRSIIDPLVIERAL
jgi:1-acyl-sn-glycerol-3-phosphate acyltransferase